MTAFSRKELLRVFEALGAEAPDSWAQSQLEEGIPQLHRFVFLTKAWSRIPDERNDGWIDADIEAHRKDPNAPMAGAGQVLGRLRDLGATDAELTELVRAKMAEQLFHVAYLLSNPGYEPDARYQAPAVAAVLERVQWALVALDADGNVMEGIDGLHESVLETDPLHREVRPRPR